MNKKDYFYYGKMDFVPIYYQPETHEAYGINSFCDFLLNILADIHEFTGTKFKISIKPKTIKRYQIQSLKKR